MDAKIKETSTALLEYKDNIMYVRIIENAELTKKTVREQREGQSELAGEEPFGVLVDGTLTATVTKGAREEMATNVPPNRKATAIVTNNNMVTRLLGNFYMKLNKPTIPTRLFEQEVEALQWLQKQVAV